jgi:sigma-B regulation protein RsbU (phosphoserine phosphatase)
MSRELAARTPRVFLFEPNPLLAHAVRLMMDQIGDVIFRSCGDPAEAVEIACEFEPTLILQAFEPVSGIELLKSFREHAATCQVPILLLAPVENAVIKAKAFGSGANDFLLRFPPHAEFVSRILYHSDAYLRLLERNRAFKRIADELEEGRRFLQELLPKRMEVPFPMDYRFIPCAELGGDMIQCHRIADDQYAMYVIDVSGHGLQCAFLAVTVMSVIRSELLPNVDLTNPAGVLRALNDRFPMESNGNRYFTIWYGVYNATSKQLSWAAGGHPPALLSTGPELVKLASDGFPIGWVPNTSFVSHRRSVSPGDRLYVYSDGVVDIYMTDGKVRQSSEFIQFLSKELGQSGDEILEHVVTQAITLCGSRQFNDDFSIMEFRF